jgi:uncharacterized membrane protein YdjX (TVP38/TMEM64 family)
MDDPSPPPKPLWIRALPLALIAGLIALAWALGWFDALSFEALQRHRQELTGFVATHRALALACYFAIFLAVTLCAVPGVLWIIVIGGFLFGAGEAAALTVLAGTIGGIGLFNIAKLSVGDALRRRAGPFLVRMERGFRDDEALYLLSMRFSPFIPYCVANIAPAFLGARPWTFAWTTLIGLMPTVIMYAWIGAGLGETLETGGTPDLVSIGGRVLAPLLALSVLPLAGVALRRFGARA